MKSFNKEGLRDLPKIIQLGGDGARSPPRLLIPCQLATYPVYTMLCCPVGPRWYLAQGEAARGEPG